MEREHLIIIALILVALYMMNSSSSKDKVKAIGPAGRIRYNTEFNPLGANCPDGSPPPCREGFYAEERGGVGVV